MSEVIALSTPQGVLTYLWRKYQESVKWLSLPVGYADFVKLIARWEEKHRHYHTVEHLTRCLLWIDAWHADYHNQRMLKLFDSNHEPSQEGIMGYPATVVMALFYHDAIYDVRAKDNEEQSAQLAVLELSPSDDGSVAHTVVRQIHNLIDITKHNGRQPVSLQEKLIIDADLSSFGGTLEEYKTNSKNIRKEYLWVDLPTFQVNRLTFLEKLYESKEPMFHTEFARFNLGAKAKLNIAVEIDELRTAIARRKYREQQKTMNSLAQFIEGINPETSDKFPRKF